MRILFLSSNLPVPANNGQTMRTLALVRAISECGHEIEFYSFSPPDHDGSLEPLSSWCHSITLIPRRLSSMSGGADYSARLRALIRLKSYALERFRWLEMQEVLRKELGSGHYDLVWADSLYPLVNLPDTKVPILLNCHNVEWVILKRYAALQRNPAKRLYALVESTLMRAAERRACARSSCAALCSETDLGILRDLHADLMMTVVPNSVDTDRYAEMDVPTDAASVPTLLFTGAMDWYPNRDAVEFFAGSMLQAIRNEIGEVKFVVAGKNPPKELLERFRGVPGLEFTGTVRDMRPYLAQATVVVVPLRIGSGTRLKILEEASARKPVVSTGIGAEGLSLVNGREIALADDPAAFVKAVVHLMRDAEARAAMGQSARQRVVELYSHYALRKIVEQILDLTISRTSGEAIREIPEFSTSRN